MKSDCEHCQEGYFAIRECPRKYLGRDFIDAVNYASISGNGDWPVPGGLLEQANWFLQLKQELEGEQNRIDSEKQSG